MRSSRPEHVVLVSDRGPVQFANRSGELVAARRSGSVTALLDGIARSAPQKVTWVAPSTAGADAQAMRLGLFGALAAGIGYRCDAVAVTQEEYDRYYDDAGVSIVWSVWHGIEDDVPIRYDPEDPLASLAGYRLVNQALADRAAAVAAEGATVSVHDYQLMLAPAMLRSRRRDLGIAHFSHTPFPSRTSLCRLPAPIVWSLVVGMLGADLLGFQRPLWARRFLDCCQRLGIQVDHEHGWVRYRGRLTWVRCYPVTVDGAALITRARSRDVLCWARRTRAEDPRRVIARVDRLDPAKNALRGFEAYARLLRCRPELAGEVRFVACLVPSRERLPDYRRYAERALRVVHDVNGRHPGAITVHHGEDRDRALGVMRVHDVLLVNAVADGMNLVAQEGPLVNDNDGATVLSSGAGSADLLRGAVALDRPRSVEATAAALDTALALPSQQRRDRARRMRAAVSRSSPADWFGHQLADVKAVSSGATPCCALPPLTPHTNRSGVVGDHGDKL